MKKQLFLLLLLTTYPLLSAKKQSGKKSDTTVQQSNSQPDTKTIAQKIPASAPKPQSTVHLKSIIALEAAIIIGGIYAASKFYLKEYRPMCDQHNGSKSIIDKQSLTIDKLKKDHADAVATYNNAMGEQDNEIATLKARIEGYKKALLRSGAETVDSNS